MDLYPGSDDALRAVSFALLSNQSNRISSTVTKVYPSSNSLSMAFSAAVTEVS